jgi:hypothetical protein
MLQSSKVRANALLLVFIAEFLLRPPGLALGLGRLRTFYAAGFDAGFRGIDAPGCLSEG